MRTVDSSTFGKRRKQAFGPRGTPEPRVFGYVSSCKAPPTHVRIVTRVNHVHDSSVRLPPTCKKKVSKFCRFRLTWALVFILGSPSGRLDSQPRVLAEKFPVHGKRDLHACLSVSPDSIGGKESRSTCSAAMSTKAYQIKEYHMPLSTPFIVWTTNAPRVGGGQVEERGTAYMH